MNYKIRDFQQNIIHFINSADLDIEVKRLVIANILSQLEAVSRIAINNEIIKIQEAENNGRAAEDK